ncbi:MAG: GNAT family N-acetyltransferase, partial [Odoribacter sp.]|nr:GNAT family N-acetyltransferase [Odoribacter sp.]
MFVDKEKYEDFCKTTFVPLYSKSWWLDAVCEPDNWNVWLYDNNGIIQAAMPYYFTVKNNRKYITKAPLTQNNGIIFAYPEGSKNVAMAMLEEKVIDAACQFIQSLNLDVYEQQYQFSFINWLPFFWNYYTAVVRYTYVLEDTSDLGAIWEGINSKRRSVVKKGQRNSKYSDSKLGIETFYKEHEKIYTKQGLKCPFSYEMWVRIANACAEHNTGKFSCRLAEDGNVAAVSFVAWDERTLYKLMGGPIPDYAKLDAYSALTWDEIELAHELGVSYDFEGSVIKRISKSFREYGAEPKPYFRIRKVFNPEII